MTNVSCQPFFKVFVTYLIFSWIAVDRKSETTHCMYPASWFVFIWASKANGGVYFVTCCERKWFTYMRATFVCLGVRWQYFRNNHYRCVVMKLICRWASQLHFFDFFWEWVAYLMFFIPKHIGLILSLPRLQRTSLWTRIHGSQRRHIRTCPHPTQSTGTSC